MNQLQISRDVGMSYQGVRGIIRRYKLDGTRSLTPKARGRKGEDQRLLTPEQENEIKRLICERRPEQLKMAFALWNRAAVAQLVKQEYGIELAVHTIGDYYNSDGGCLPDRKFEEVNMRASLANSC